MWKLFVDLCIIIIDLWCICGDFNVVLCDVDRIGGRRIIFSEIYDFYEFIYNYNIIEMRVLGCDYIWLNGYVSSKIDIVLCNLKWVL